METVAVVMPVYNEGAGLREVVLDWLGMMKGLDAESRLHVYNDGSTDESLEVLRELERGRLGLSVHDKPNTGHGPTLVSAYRAHAETDWIFQTDSDGEIKAGDFPALWDKRADFDFLLGRRTGRRQSAGRSLLSALSRAAVRLLYGRGLYDVNSPFRLMRCSAFRAHFDRIPADTFAPNVLLSGAACAAGMRILEAPVRHHSRRKGVSVFDAHLGSLAATAAKSFVQTVEHRFAA